jgi:hypothetical protein
MLTPAGLVVKDALVVGIAGASLLASVAGFVLNRRYTRTTFASTQYPQLRLYGLTPESFRMYPPAIDGQLWNDSRIEAINMQIDVTVVRGLRRSTWREIASAKGPPAGKSETLRIKLRADALAKVASNHLALDRDGFSSLTLHKGTSVPSLGLVIELSWLPPLYRAKRINERYLGTLSGKVEGDTLRWRIADRRRLLGWRPITLLPSRD